MNVWPRGSIPLLAALLAACGAGNADPAFEEAAPRFDSMSMDVTGDPAEEGLGIANASTSELGGSEIALGLHARWAAKLTNLHVHRVLRLVEHLLKTQPTEITEDTHVWLREGPNRKIEVKLTVKKDGDNHFTYTLEVRKTGENDRAFVKVAEGDFTRGDAKGEGAGTIVMTYERLGGKDGDVKATGTLTVAWSIDDGRKDVTAEWTRFKDDLVGHSKEINGRYIFRKFLHTGNASMRFARDTSSSFSGAEVDTEYRAIARWNRSIGGVGFARLRIQTPTGEKQWKLRECWSAGLGITYRRVFDENGAVVAARSIGEPTDCPMPADIPEPPEAEADATASADLTWPVQ